jgi:hypothetical protein
VKGLLLLALFACKRDHDDSSESRSLNVHFTFDGGRVRVIHLMFGSAALTMTNPTPL